LGRVGEKPIAGIAAGKRAFPRGCSPQGIRVRCPPSNVLGGTVSLKPTISWVLRRPKFFFYVSLFSHNTAFALPSPD
jgi:hypothetical protein